MYVTESDMPSGQNINKTTEGDKQKRPQTGSSGRFGTRRSLRQGEAIHADFVTVPWLALPDEVVKHPGGSGRNLEVFAVIEGELEQAVRAVKVELVPGHAPQCDGCHDE